MLQPIDNMRALAELCQSHKPLPEGLASWLATSLEAFLDHKSPSLNDAFGMRKGRGGVPWRLEASIHRRDAALRALAAEHLSQLSLTAQSVRVHRLSLRYAISSWRFDREKEEMPPAYLKTPQEHLWRAFKSGAVMPLGERQLRTILAS